MILTDPAGGSLEAMRLKKGFFDSPCVGGLVTGVDGDAVASGVEMCGTDGAAAAGGTLATASVGRDNS